MLYFDTSFVAPLVLHESSSRQIDDLVIGLQPEELAVSRWTCVEFSSLLARDVRMRIRSPQEALNAEIEFDDLIRASFRVITPTADDFDRSRRYLREFKTGLRAGDAFHLAIASNRQASAIFSLDEGMIKAGRLLDLPVQGKTS